MKKVIRLTESELTNLIQRIVEETKDEMMNTSNMDGEMEEGLFGPSRKEMAQRREDLRNKLEAKLMELGLEEDDLYKSLESTLNAAEEDNYEGDDIIVKRSGSTGEPFLVVKSPESKFHKSKFYQNVMQPMVGGLKGGHTFGGGSGN